MLLDVNSYTRVKEARRPLPPPHPHKWPKRRVAIGNHPSNDRMTGLYSTQRRSRILKWEKEKKRHLASAAAVWSLYFTVKRWMRVNAVVGCGRVRYWFPGVSLTWQLGCLENDSSATVEASQPTLKNHLHLFLQLLSLRCLSVYLSASENLPSNVIINHHTQ